MQTENENATAVKVQILYLLNLLIIPGIAFVMIYKLFQKNIGTTNELTRRHVSQALVGSVAVGVLIIGFISLMLIFGAWDDPYTWMWIVLYFTCFHASFILLGVFGLVKAMANQTFHYPLMSSLADKLKGYEPKS